MNFRFIPSFMARIILFLLDLVSIYKFSLFRGILINFVIISTRNKNRARVGRFSKIAGGTQISNFGSLIIHDSCWISINSRFVMREGTYITIGNNTCIGPELMVISDSHIIGQEYKRSGKAIFDDIEIGSGCWIGARVTILPGVLAKIKKFLN